MSRRKLTHMHATLTKVVAGELIVKGESWDEHDFSESGKTFDEVIEQYAEHDWDVRLDLKWEKE